MQGVLDGAGFPARVTAHFVAVEGQARPRTTILIKFADEVCLSIQLMITEGFRILVMLLNEQNIGGISRYGLCLLITVILSCNYAWFYCLKFIMGRICRLYNETLVLALDPQLNELLILAQWQQVAASSITSLASMIESQSV